MGEPAAELEEVNSNADVVLCALIACKKPHDVTLQQSSAASDRAVSHDHTHLAAEGERQ